MKDMLGNEIEVGDTIVYGRTNYSGSTNLVKAKVTRITKTLETRHYRKGYGTVKESLSVTTFKSDYSSYSYCTNLKNLSNIAVIEKYKI